MFFHQIVVFSSSKCDIGDFQNMQETIWFWPKIEGFRYLHFQNLRLAALAEIFPGGGRSTLPPHFRLGEGRVVGPPLMRKPLPECYDFSTLVSTFSAHYLHIFSTFTAYCTVQHNVSQFAARTSLLHFVTLSAHFRHMVGISKISAHMVNTS